MKAVFVTGVSSGLGKAIAESLISRGYFVFGSIRNESDLAALSHLPPESFSPLQFDVRDPDAISRAVRQTADRLEGRYLRALINNAGVAASGPLQFIPLEIIQDVFAVNVFGLLRVTQAFLPLLGGTFPQTDAPGKIINISSISGRASRPFYGPYSASKHAVESLTDTLRRELALYGIDAISIQPGPVLTEIWPKARREEALYPDTPFGEILSKRQKVIDQMEKIALPARTVAEKVAEAVDLPLPKTRQLIMRNSWMVKLLLHLIPDRTLDKLMLRQYQKMIQEPS